MFYLLYEIVNHPRKILRVHVDFLVPSVFQQGLVIDLCVCLCVCVCVMVLPKNRKTWTYNVAKPYSHPVVRQTCYF